MACKILYKGEYYDKNDFQNLLRDPAFAEQVRVSMVTDEFMKMWVNPANKNMSVTDILNQLANQGVSSANINSELQKIKAELVDRDMKGISGEGKPIEATVKDRTAGPTVRWYTGSSLQKIAKWLDHNLFNGVMRAELPNVYESYRGVTNFVNHSMFKVNKLTAVLNKFLEDNKDLLTKDDKRAITAIVQGAGKDRLLLLNVSDPAKADAIRNEIFDIASKMRMHIDNLSEALINSGFIKEAGVDIYLNNLGKYTARVYETHLNPENWWTKLTSSDPDMAYIFNRGRNFIKKSLEDRWTKLAGIITNLNKEINKLNQKRAANTAANPFTKQDLERLELLVNRRNNLDGEVKRLEDLILDDSKLDDYIKEMLSGTEGDVVTPGTAKINLDLGLFKKRKDIPEEIRALMGEITDPAELYIVSVKRMASFLAKYEFQMNFALEGEGILFSRTLDNENGFTVKTPVGKMPGLRAMLGIGPDKYIYLPKSLAEDIKGAMGLDEDSPTNKFMEWLGFFNASAKMSATVYNPGSHVRNFLGAGFFLLLNGYITSRHVVTSLRTVVSEIASSASEKLGKDSTSELMQTVQELAVQTGVLNSNVDIEQLKELMRKDNRVMKAMQDFIDSKGAGGVTKFIKSFFTLPIEIYQGTDNVFKIAGFLSELDRNSRLYGFNSFNDMLLASKSSDPAVAKKAADAISEVSKEASRTIRNTFPNYAEAYRYNTYLNKVPFLGLFTTFVSETIRTGINSTREVGRLAVKIKNETDPNKKKIYKEIMLARVFGLSAVTAVTFLQENLRDILTPGCDEDDEECRKLKGKSKFVEVKGRDTFMKYYTPEWTKHVDLRRDPDNPDGFIYSDPSTINPFSLWRQRVGERTTSDNFAYTIMEVLAPILEPILATEIGYKFISQLTQGEDMYGEEITPYKFEDNPGLFLRDMSAYILKAPINPLSSAYKAAYGDWSTLSTRIRNDEELLEKTSSKKEREKIQDRIRQNQYKIEQGSVFGIEFLQVSGYKSNYVDLTTQAGFKTYEVAESIQTYKDTYNKRKGSTSDIDALYEESNAAYQKELNKLRDMVRETKENLGVDVGDAVAEVMKNSRFNKKEIAYVKGYNKEIPDISIKDYEKRRR